MLRRLGSLVWKQTRDMSVMNYSNHLVYEIFTNHGYMYVVHNKTTDKIEIVNGLSMCNEASETKTQKIQDEEIFLPTLK